MVETIQTILDQRLQQRKERAMEVARAGCRYAEGKGFSLRVVGSLARGDFKGHSDVDFLGESATFDSKCRLEGEIQMLSRGFPFHIIWLDEVSSVYYREKLLGEARNASDLD